MMMRLAVLSIILSTVFLIAAKLTGVIGFHWWWILIPSAAFGVASVVVILGCMYLAATDEDLK